MKKNIFLQILLSILFLQQSNHVFSQWIQSSGLDGGETYSIASLDSSLFITTGSEDVYAKFDNGTWEKIAIGYNKVAIAGNCVIMYDSYWHNPKRSFDYGQTWETINSAFNTSDLLIIDTVFFGGSENKLRSFDYGTTFDTIQLPTELMVNRILSDGELLYLHCNDWEETYKIYYSEDLGNTWDSISAIGMVDDYPYFDVPQMKKLNGHYWVQIEFLSAPYSSRRLKVYNDIYNKWIDVTNNLPKFKEHFDIFEYKGDILCSIDSYPVYLFNVADSTWIQFADATKNVTKFAIHNDELYCSTLQGVCALDTAGNWTTHYEGFSLRDISSISIYDNNIYVTANNELFVSDDKGESFSLVDYAYGLKLITTDSVFYMMGLHEFKMSWNEGETWHSFSDSIENYLNTINTSLSISPDYYYLGTRRGLYQSPTDSISWTLVENGVIDSDINVIDVESINYSVLLGSSYPGYKNIYQSLDNGNNFNIFEADVYPIRRLDQTYYLLKDSIYYSNDIGVTWEKIPVNEEGYLKCIDRRADTIFVGGFDVYGHLQAQITYDNGNYWFDIVDDLPEQSYTSNSIWVAKIFDNRLFVSNTKYGLWYRDDLIVGEQDKEYEARLADHFVKTYPNPFTTSTTIEYELTHPETVRITFYNSFGRVVDIIEQHQSQGAQKAVWTPKNLPEGIYHFRLEANQKMVSGTLLKMR